MKIKLSELNKPETLDLKETISFFCNIKSYLIRATKNGNQFGVLEVEDELSSEKFYLFGEIYVQYSPTLSENKSIIISGKFSPKRFNNSD